MKQSCSINLLKYILSLLIFCAIFEGEEGGEFYQETHTKLSKENSLWPFVSSINHGVAGSLLWLKWLTKMGAIGRA